MKTIINNLKSTIIETDRQILNWIYIVGRWKWPKYFNGKCVGAPNVYKSKFMLNTVEEKRKIKYILHKTLRKKYKIQKKKKINKSRTKTTTLFICKTSTQTKIILYLLFSYFLFFYCIYSNIIHRQLIFEKKQKKENEIICKYIIICIISTWRRRKMFSTGVVLLVLEYKIWKSKRVGGVGQSGMA